VREGQVQRDGGAPEVPQKHSKSVQIRQNFRESAINIFATGFLAAFRLSIADNFSAAPPSTSDLCSRIYAFMSHLPPLS